MIIQIGQGLVIELLITLMLKLLLVFRLFVWRTILLGQDCLMLSNHGLCVFLEVFGNHAAEVGLQLVLQFGFPFNSALLNEKIGLP